MPLATIDLEAEMLDGTTHRVRILNVDMCGWDRHRAKFGLPAPDVAPLLWMNYLLWHALKREGTFDGTLAEFEGAALVVGSPTENGDGPAEVDPTNRVAEPE